MRPAFDALFDIDDAMADVVAQATQPALGAIKLAWWRERLLELDAGKVPAEPRLQQAFVELLSRGIPGHDLAELEQGWTALFQPEPDIGKVGERGAKLFAMAARLLGFPEPSVGAAGRAHAFQQVRRWDLLASPLPENDFPAVIYPKGLRPLTVLGALAARDARHRGSLEPEATPGRALAMLRHRLTGRIRP